VRIGELKRTTIGRVGKLAVIAGTVSHLHMHLLVELHGSRAGSRR
jgi:diadenosine tetraphosphate (Ap4A) HIT family hydrolase